MQPGAALGPPVAGLGAARPVAVRQGRSVISAVVVDVDGVLRRWDPRTTSGAEQAHGLPAGSLAAAAFAEPALTRAVTGAMSDAEWRKDVARRLESGTGAAATSCRAAVAQWSEPAGEVDQAVLELLRWQRTEHRVVLLSNATDRLDDDLERLGLTTEVDAVFNSSRLGVAKPDPAVFALVCAQLGLPPRRCAFVDDTAGHVTAATAAGLRAHHFVGVEGLRRFLSDLPHPTAAV